MIAMEIGQQQQIEGISDNLISIFMFRVYDVTM